MPYNGSGLFTRNYNWVNDRNAAIPITASRVDADSNDFASGLSMVVTRDGQGPVTSLLNVNGVGATPFVGAGTSDNVSTYILLNKGAGSHANNIFSCMNGLLRWQFEFGNRTSEAGGNSGSDFVLDRYDDSGTYVDSPIIVARNTGVVTISNLNVLSGITAPISATNITASGNLSIGGTSSFTGVATFHAPIGVQLSVAAGQTAEYLCIVAGQRQWGIGEQPTGYFRIVDYTAGLERLTINSAGLVTIGGDLVANSGIAMGSAVAPGGALDLSRHIALFGTSYGFSITASTLNLVAGGAATIAVTASGATVTGTFVSTGNMTCSSNFNTNQINGTVIIANNNIQCNAGAAFAPYYSQNSYRSYYFGTDTGGSFAIVDANASAYRFSITNTGAVTIYQTLNVNSNCTVSGNFNTNGISGSSLSCPSISAFTCTGQINVSANGIAYNRLNGGQYLEFNYGGGTTLNFYAGGVARGTWGFNSPSDERIKENIAAAEGDALAELCAVKLISYDQTVMRDPERTHTACGFSAQQMETIIPEAVSRVRVEPTDPERDLKAKPYTYDELMLTIDVMPLLARLVGAVQQLASRIETLEARA